MKKYLLGLGLAVVLLGVGGVVWLRAAPAVEPLAATPAYVVKSTPTPVLFTIKITDASLVLGGVNLLRTDAAGKTLSTVGVMRDDGMSGDAIASDRTFTFRLTVDQPTVGQVFFRASAAFRGTLARTLSNVIPVNIDPFTLPPDPGEAGKLTLPGIDSDNDGVRDDVQRYIGLTYHEDASIRAALMGYATALQKYMTTGTEPVALANLTDVLAIVDCVSFRFGAETGSTMITALRNVVVNTNDRARVYLTSWRSVHDLPPPSTASDLMSRCSS